MVASNPQLDVMKIILTISFLLGLFITGFSQVTNEGGNIMVNGAQFTVGGDLTNNGTIINNGNLLISGAWINNGTYDPGTGQITFNSDLPQIVNHNDQAFRRLTISGGGEKRFLANITIEDELVLQNGNLLSENGAKIIFQPNAVINGGNDQSHIIGPVEQQGAGSWLFPIGNATTYLPVEIKDVEGANTKAVLILHELASGEELAGTPGVTQLSSKRYWELNVLEGSLENSLITLPLRNENLTGDAALYAIAESDEATASYASIGQSEFTGDPTNGAITSESSPTKSYFTVVTVSGEKNIVVYNGVSPNGDDLNDYLKILNIELFPDNKVMIFNRWGDKIFEMSGYDNKQRIFIGEDNLKGNAKISSGTYYYKIIPGDGSKELTGYLQLKNELR